MKANIELILDFEAPGGYPCTREISFNNVEISRELFEDIASFYSGTKYSSVNIKATETI